MDDTILDILKKWSIETPHQHAFTFIEHYHERSHRLSYGELYQRSLQLAGKLADIEKGERIVICLPQGLDYIISLFGVMYAGCVAVPLYPPKVNKEDHRVKKIISDSDPALIIGTRKIYNACLQANKSLTKRPWLCIDQDDHIEITNVDNDFTSDQVAIIQYTSGSTSQPKGVMISHGNIMNNSAVIKKGFQFNEKTRKMTWLPFFHDMGLIGDVMQPIYSHFHNVFISPQEFVQKPLRWLKAIHDYKVTHSGAPNFGYDLCVRRISREESRDLNLESWKLAYIGAEMIRPNSLESFYQRFKENGFSRHAFYPCYGMAEVTLMLTGGQFQNGYRTISLDRVKTLNRNEQDYLRLSKKEVVSCGVVREQNKVIIVHPKSETVLPDLTEGEIWCAGPSVMQGYYMGFETQENDVFSQTKDDQSSIYFRTGDLGFVFENELYITGRIKDLIIIRGQNYYPEDIEQVVSESHDAFLKGNCVAFSWVKSETEHLGIIQEVGRMHLRSIDPKDLESQVKRTITTEFEISPEVVLLVKPNSLLKTTSGKLKRQENRERFLSGHIESLN